MSQSHPLLQALAHIYVSFFGDYDGPRTTNEQVNKVDHLRFASGPLPRNSNSGSSQDRKVKIHEPKKTRKYVLLLLTEQGTGWHQVVSCI